MFGLLRVSEYGSHSGLVAYGLDLGEVILFQVSILFRVGKN